MLEDDIFRFLLLKVRQYSQVILLHEGLVVPPCECW